MFQEVLNYINSYGWLFVFALNIIYIIVRCVIVCLKNRKVDVDLLYKTLCTIPNIMEQAEYLFPSGRGASKLDYVCNVIKILIGEENPNKALLCYDWQKLIQEIFDSTKVINSLNGGIIENEKNEN